MFILGINIFCQNSQSGVNSSRVPPNSISTSSTREDGSSVDENSTMLQNQYADLLEEDEYFKKCWVKENRNMQGAWIIPDHVLKMNLANLSRGQRILPQKNIFWRGANHTDRVMEVKGRLVTFESWRSFIISLDLYQQLTIFPPKSPPSRKKKPPPFNFF